MRKSRGRGGQPAEFDPGQPPEVDGIAGLTLIGTGGSASVYKGQETAMRRPVAVKILHARLRDARERTRFEGECGRAGEVGEHPYAVSIYSRGFADDWPFLVMQYYPVGSLAGTLPFASQRPVGEALTICAKVACALQYAHNLTIVHRDVKPGNILLGAYGDPALADFGISADLDDASRTLRHAMTPAYAAPEVLQRGGGWSYTDVWSLAATLYALLAGHPPFYDHRRPDPMANLVALDGPLPPVSRPDLPGHVVQTLSRALIGRYDRRTPSAQRFAEELNADLELLGLPAVPVKIEPDSHAPLPRAPLPRAPLPRAPLPPRLPEPRQPVPPSQFTPPGQFTPPAAGGWTGPATERTNSGFAPYGAGGPATEHAPTGESLPYPQPAEAERDPARGRRRTLALAGGGGVVAVAAISVAAYLATGSSPSAASRPGPATLAPVTSSPATPSAVAAGQGAIQPPRDVTATLVGGTSVRLSWANAGSQAGDAQVIISMGSGYNVRAMPNKPPQVITGLTAGQPYCFAVGYFLASGKVFYSTVNASSCVNGGIPS